ncbi:anthranilate synthase component I family protein [Nocardioidaceae bacterium]|nr:anthranilate synthase component I family protein [Nocardioidaceae bacterium]
MTVPADVLAALHGDHPRLFWLDGGGSRDWSRRRSVLGVLEDDDVSLTYDAARREVVRHRGDTHEVVGDDVFTVLGEHLAHDAEHAPEVQWVGYFGYASNPAQPAAPGAVVPDAVWMRARTTHVVEEPGRLPDPRPAPQVQGGEVPGWYATAFAAVQEALHRGDSYEVNLTYRERLKSDVDPVEAYLRLRAANPAPYACFLRHPGVALLSSSPERFAVVRADRTVETKPIKGTTLRGATPEDDAAEARRLVTDPRFRAENLMVTDLLRHDIGGISEVGSVEVPGLMEVETYPHVHQLVSTVRGRMRREVSTVQALRALFPAGSMTGAPKRRTMEIIDTVESSPRGAYAGAVGWLAADGRADLGVVIRSLVTDGAGTWELGTGGGVTVHSDVAEEWAETRWKVARLRAVLED